MCSAGSVWIFHIRFSLVRFSISSTFVFRFQNSHITTMPEYPTVKTLRRSQSYINNPYRPCATEVRALYGRLSCHWLRVVTLATCHAAGRNGHCASNGGFLNGRACRLGPFSTAGAHRLWAFVHYRSSHNRAFAIVACIL